MIAYKADNAGSLEDLQPSVPEWVDAYEQISAKERHFHPLLSVTPLTEFRSDRQVAVDAEGVDQRGRDLLLPGTRPNCVPVRFWIESPAPAGNSRNSRLVWRARGRL